LIGFLFFTLPGRMNERATPLVMENNTDFPCYLPERGEPFCLSSRKAKKYPWPRTDNEDPHLVIDIF
jgi:hypothetical protein